MSASSVGPLCSPPVRAAALEGYVRICLAQYLLLAEKQKRLAADPNNRTGSSLISLSRSQYCHEGSPPSKVKAE